jgi:hypothetical protein
MFPYRAHARTIAYGDDRSLSGLAGQLDPAPETARMFGTENVGHRRERTAHAAWASERDIDPGKNRQATRRIMW